MAKRKEAIFAPCPLHPSIEAGQTEIKGMLGKIFDKLEENGKEIVRLQDTVENGLKSAVKETHATVIDIKERVLVIETGIKNFSWFTEWVTDLRTDLFKKVLKLAFYGGLAGTIIWFILSFGKQAITRIFS
jgi:hypothetical protein